MEFPLHITIKNLLALTDSNFGANRKKQIQNCGRQKTASRPDSTQNPAYTFDTLKQIAKSVAQSHLDTIVSHH